MPLSFGAIIAIFVAITATLHGTGQISIPSFYSTRPSVCSFVCPQKFRDFHTEWLEHKNADKPYHSSWSSWWHPQRSNGTLAEHKLGAGGLTQDWNILYHLGGNGPWVEKVIDVVDDGVAPPESCEVVQVHMVRRIYVSLRAGS